MNFQRLVHADFFFNFLFKRQILKLILIRPRVIVYRVRTSNGLFLNFQLMPLLFIWGHTQKRIQLNFKIISMNFGALTDDL